MNAKPIFITAVLSATFLAGCDQGADKTGTAPINPPPPTVTQNKERPEATPPAAQRSQTPSTAAERRKDGDETVQGKMDTKEPPRQTSQAPKG